MDDLEELSAAAVGFSRTQEPIVAALASVVPAIQGLELEELEQDEAETGGDFCYIISVLWRGKGFCIYTSMPQAVRSCDLNWISLLARL